MFYKDERRQILSVLGDQVAVKKTSVVSMGGAHPIRDAEIERISLLDGEKRPALFPLRSSVSSAVYRSKAKKRSCLSEHEDSVALRGPGGLPIPAAVLGGALESCRGDLALAWTPVHTGRTMREAVALGTNAKFHRDAVYLKNMPLVVGVVDVVPLRGVAAALVLQGKAFRAPTGAKRSSSARNSLSFLPLSRGTRPERLGRVAPILSAQAIPALGLDQQQLNRLWKAFGIRNPERRR
jgi:hypothetical protein